LESSKCKGWFHAVRAAGEIDGISHENSNDNGHAMRDFRPKPDPNFADHETAIGTPLARLEYGKGALARSQKVKSFTLAWGTTCPCRMSLFRPPCPMGRRWGKGADGPRR
jgi:hypothetical protein